MCTEGTNQSKIFSDSNFQQISQSQIQSEINPIGSCLNSDENFMIQNHFSAPPKEKQTTQSLAQQFANFDIGQLKDLVFDDELIYSIDQMDNNDCRLFQNDLPKNNTQQNDFKKPICQSPQIPNSQQICNNQQAEHYLAEYSRTTQINVQQLTPEGNGFEIQEINKQTQNSDNQLQMMKRHQSERPISLRNFIVSDVFVNRLAKESQFNQPSQNILALKNQKTLEMEKEIEFLKKQLNDKQDEVVKLKDNMNRISQSIAKIYPSLQLLSKDIQDQDLLQILSQGFLAQAKLHLAFLFSSPLITINDFHRNQKNQQIKVCQPINHQEEFCGVLQSLKETGNQIRYSKILATLDNLRASLTENPVALHFSGHGIENKFGIVGEGNFLVFEDHEGCAQLLSERKLTELLEASGTKLEFVFVASCYSQFAGEIFHAAGAKHVICVKRGYQIRDDASIIFSKHFYHALFSQTISVCQAFELAKVALSSNQNRSIAAEASKFVLLKDIDEVVQSAPCPQNFLAVPTFQHRPTRHKCLVFGPLIKGQIQNVASEPIFKVETSKVEDFLGRFKEMQEIISNIISNRFVTIKGIPGIGKTTIGKAITHYLDERKLFKDGIIELSLRGLDQANMVLTRLQFVINKHTNHQPEKDDKAVETYQQIQDRIIQFLKDKEILLFLDNAEDTQRKEGNLFREIIHSLLNSCPRLKMLLTSRYPFGHLADISERVYTLKELTSKFAIQLLLKKAMRPINDSEIHELLKSAKPNRVLHANPNKHHQETMRLDDHHICQLLGGHPHAISLAAPLLQDKSLKELYVLLNSPDIIEWLKIEGIQGTLVSLKVSMDTSINHMSDQEPLAIKLFCIIGLFPGGVTEDDLNNLWKQGWNIYIEKLLRASLLVKKATENGDSIRYTLFPFMNQYAVQLMDSETYLKEHKNSVLYLSKVCKDMLKLTQVEVVNKLVQFETNIWACIYRIIDKTPSGQNLQESVMTRAKSPAYLNKNLLESQINTNENNNLKSLYDDSSQGGNSSERIPIDPNSNDDYYDNILSQRRDNDNRSRSEKLFVKRGMDDEDHQNSDNKSLISSEEIKKSVLEEDERVNSSEFQRSRGSFQPQIAVSLYEGIDEKLNEQEEFIDDLDQSFAKSLLEESSSNNNDYVSDDQIQLLLSSHSQIKNIQKKLKNLKIAVENNSSNLDYSSIDLDKKNYNNQFTLNSQNQDESSSINVQSNSINGDQQNTSSNSLSQGSILRQNQELTYQRLLTLPNTPQNQLLQNFDDNQSVIMHNDMYETSSMDSLQSQILNMNTQNNSLHQQQDTSSFMNSGWGLYQNQQTSKIDQRRRKSAYSIQMRQNYLDEINETLDEDNSCINYDNNPENEQDKIEDTNNILHQIEREIENEPNNIRKISSKKYHEDEKILQLEQKSNKLLQIPENQIAESNFSATENQNDSIKKKGKNKKVTIQENNNQVAQLQLSEPKKLHRPPQGNQVFQEAPHHSILSLTPDGGLFVYYITTLVISSKFDEALKTIEHFGLKLQNDNLCIANLKKIQGYLISEISQNFKESLLKYEEALKIFTQLKIYHGQAVCSFAIGFLLYAKPSAFITKKMNENKVYEKAMKKLEDAVNWYNKVQHFNGEAYCHKILAFIKKKVGENSAEHEVKLKKLVKMQKQKKNDGRNQFIELGVPKAEVSLFLDIVQQQMNYPYEINIQRQIVKAQAINEQAEKSMNYNFNSNMTSIPQIAIPKSARQNQLQNQQHQSQRKTRIDQPEKSKEDFKPAFFSSNPLQSTKKPVKTQPEKVQILRQSTSNQSLKSKMDNEFDNWKKQLEIERQKPILDLLNNDLEQIQEYIPHSTIKVKKPEQKIIQASQISGSNQRRNKEKSQNTKEETKVEEINQELKIKKLVNFTEKGQLAIQKYKNSRNEQIEKAKTQTLSASFIQPKNQVPIQVNQVCQQPSGIPKISQKPKNQIQTTSFINNDGKDISNINHLINSEMPFDTATELEFSMNNSDDEAHQSNRFSLLESGITSGSTQQNNQQQLSIQSQKRQNLIAGRLSERPGTSMSSNNDNKKSSFKAKRTTVETAKVKDTNLQKQQIKSAVAEMRPSSPNTVHKKTMALSKQSKNQQSTPSKDIVMEVSVTTTTTTKVIIKDGNKNTKVIVDSKPEICVEALDQDN